MSLVTVMVCTYDHTDTIIYTIKSIQAQTFQDFEIFVVGDGAPPRTDSIMKELCDADSRIRYFPNPKGEEHGELSRAKALEYASGQIVCYCGDDDLWLDNHLQTIIPLLETNDFVNTHEVSVNPSGKITIFSESFSAKSSQLRMLEKNTWNVCGPTPVAHTMKAYKKLPHGWRPRPKGTPSDLYMWQQWLAQSWCKFHTESAVTTLHFPSPLRKGWSINERVTELEKWWQRISQPDFNTWLEREWRHDWQKRTERANFYATLGNSLFKNKEYKLAEQVYRKAYEAEKKASFCSHLSNVLRLQGELVESLFLAKEAIELEKDNYLFHMRLGLVFMQMREHSKALQVFTDALELQEVAPLYFHIGRCYEKLNDLPKAKEFVKKALTLKPQSQNFKQYLKKIQIENNKWFTIKSFLKKIGNYLSDKQRACIIKTTYFFAPTSKKLKLLASKYSTNKLEHGYLSHYHRHFCPLRRKKLNILEIGVRRAASLKMWRDYFSRSFIYGIDKEEQSQYKGTRIRTFQGSQQDTEFLEKVVKKTGKFDIIIDDGSHVSEHIVTSFCYLFPHLSDNGIYVIEDLMASYWPHSGGSWKDLQNFPSAINYLKSLVDRLNHAHIAHYQSDYFDKNIISIHFYPKIAFIFKGKNCPILSQKELEWLEDAKNSN
ncbi:glycosyltransferase [Candidatus Uabimicrobium sp. HlEnr_7]|uniref:glycosyltransferase n=1 Tax=Candidatus Uabimicrobium helgolandensis TaxID=3095367 RepID=UPI0035564A3C